MKKILIFSNGEQIGDGILKLVLVYQLRNRFPEHEIHWATDKIKTVYDTILKSFVSDHIDVIWSQSNLSPFFGIRFQISMIFKITNLISLSILKKLFQEQLRLKELNQKFLYLRQLIGYFQT